AVVEREFCGSVNKSDDLLFCLWSRASACVRVLDNVEVIRIQTRTEAGDYMLERSDSIYSRPRTPHVFSIRPSRLNRTSSTLQSKVLFSYNKYGKGSYYETEILRDGQRHHQ